jgi:PAS domain S-box-containing protein
MEFKFRFTIAQKLAIGFGVLLLAVLSTSILTYSTLQRNLEDNKRIKEIYNPSANLLNNLYSLIAESKMLIKNWAYIEKKPETADKKKLVRTHAVDFPNLNSHIEELADSWEKDEQAQYANIKLSIDTLFDYHKGIMSTLNDFASYSNTGQLFEMYSQVESDGQITVLTDRVLNELDGLRKRQEVKVMEANQAMEKSFSSFQKQVVWMGFLLVFSVISIAVWVTNTLVGPISSIKQVIERMGQGILPQGKLKVRGDEIGDMASALNSLVVGLRSTSKFALLIGEGDFESEYNPLGDNDVLGNALLVMRENLKRAAREDLKRKEENAERSWAAQGLAKFGEILRENNESIEELSSVIISNLVKYLDANQGGLFIINEEKDKERFIELVAFYAYSRKKYLEKKILIGENLVGQCVQEGETILMTDLPKGYIEITSGLGQDTPRSLMIVPLKLNEEIYGVVEIASFNKFKPYQVEFVEKIGETIASTIQRVRVNIQTNILLEESRRKSEMLAQQEAEVRDLETESKPTNPQQIGNSELIKEIEILEKKVVEQFEELEENRILYELKENELAETSHSINNTLGRLTIDFKGRIIDVNDYILAQISLPLEMLQGKFLSDFLSDDELAALDYQDIWAKLSQGHIQTRTDKFVFENRHVWYRITYTPIKNINDEFTAIWALFENITDFKENETKLLNELERAKIALEKQALGL